MTFSSLKSYVTVYIQIKDKNAVPDLLVHFYIFIYTQKEITSEIASNSFFLKKKRIFLKTWKFVISKICNPYLVK